MRPALVGVVGYWARRALGVPVQSTTTDKEKSISLSVACCPGILRRPGAPARNYTGGGDMTCYDRLRRFAPLRSFRRFPAVADLRLNGNVRGSAISRRGDMTKGFAEADVVVDRTQVQTHFPRHSAALGSPLQRTKAGAISALAGQGAVGEIIWLNTCCGPSS
jgi:hypothetical protein